MFADGRQIGVFHNKYEHQNPPCAFLIALRVQKCAPNYAGIAHGLRMASIRKLNGQWRAEVARLGVRRSKVFPTKVEARDWAARQEYLILAGERNVSAQPFGEVLDRYAREVSVSKRGARWEQLRAEMVRRDKIAKVQIGQLSASDLADWRDRRLQQVAPGTVRREMVFLSAVLTQARKEWGMIQVHPMTDVRKPTEPPPRTRRPSDDEIARLALAAGEDLTLATARTFHAFLFAIETGMRAGEIVGLTWPMVDLTARVAHLPKTKNGTARDVPLSSEAVRLLEALPRLPTVFGLRSDQIDALWRKIRGKAAADGLHFHDSRHEAVTRLSRKLDVLALARMIGHRDIRQLQVYYNESAADLAKRLD